MKPVHLDLIKNVKNDQIKMHYSEVLYWCQLKMLITTLNAVIPLTVFWTKLPLKINPRGWPSVVIRLLSRGWRIVKRQNFGMFCSSSLGLDEHLMVGIGERKFQSFVHPWSRKRVIVTPLKFLDWIGTSSVPETTLQGVEARKRKRKKNFPGIQGDGLKFWAL